jgi:hypothetical protein
MKIFLCHECGYTQYPISKTAYCVGAIMLGTDHTPTEMELVSVVRTDRPDELEAALAAQEAT